MKSYVLYILTPLYPVCRWKRTMSNYWSQNSNICFDFLFQHFNKNVRFFFKRHFWENKATISLLSEILENVWSKHCRHFEIGCHNLNEQIRGISVQAECWDNFNISVMSHNGKINQIFQIISQNIDTSHHF